MAFSALSTLGVPDAAGRVEDLALEVRRVDDVGVDEAERADAGRREVERRGAAEAARAEQEHLAPEQLRLAGLADLGEEDVTRVAIALRVGELRAASPSG